MRRGPVRAGREPFLRGKESSRSPRIIKASFTAFWVENLGGKPKCGASRVGPERLVVEKNRNRLEKKGDDRVDNEKDRGGSIANKERVHLKGKIMRIIRGSRAIAW